MRVKRFVAPNMQEAMVKVKMDMGKDAVIIHTRKFKEGGFLGLFGTPMVEVTAAIEEKEGSATNQEAKVQTVAQPEAMPPENDSEIIDELANMKHMMQQMMDQIEGAKQVAGYTPVLQSYYQIMLDNEVEEATVRRLLKKAQDTLTAEEVLDKDKVGEFLTEAVEKLLKKPKPILFKKNNPTQQVIALVGPTGVGKTTTIAKLAATFSIVDKRKVGLITADTYRIAAVEQLKTFGEIMGLPVEVVYTPQELKIAIEKLQDKELILIDTAGRSHKNMVQMSELKGYLDCANPTEILLVMSATTKTKDMKGIVDSYKDVAVSKLIFTKLDETCTCGSILNLINYSKKQLSYFTTGQSVPDDIEVASPNKIARLVVRERS